MSTDSNAWATSGPGCARVRARLEVLIDGGLPALEEARDRGHLEACAACRAEEQQERALLAALRAAGANNLAGDLARVESVLRARLPTRSPRARALLRRRSSRLLGAAAAAAALLALAFGGRDLVLARSLGAGEVFTQFLARLPHWSDLTRGLDELARSFS